MVALLVGWMVESLVVWEAKKVVVLVDLMVLVSGELLVALMVVNWVPKKDKQMAEVKDETKVVVWVVCQ